MRDRLAAAALILAVSMAVESWAAGAGTEREPAARGDRAEAVHDDGEPRLVARLLVHPDDVAAEGPVRLGVLFDLAPGWHIYGRDPGDSGLPTELDWKVDGASLSSVPWPPTETYSEQDGTATTYGYSGQVLLATEARFDEAPGPGARAGVDVDLLACKHECIPASLHLETRIVGHALPVAERDGVRELFARFAPAQSVARLSLASALLLGLLGGLVLNLMPCVLPILGIKLLAIAELAHARRRQAFEQSLAYAAGIGLAMTLLAGVAIGLRATGSAVGWGFQLQDPVFAIVLAVVVTAFALNFFGVFEFGSPSSLADFAGRTTGARRSFFDGLLAVALATPCSAPFLGTAVGFALTRPAPVILGIFLAIGVGLAAPFVAIACVPGWSRLVPRSGPWMQPLRRGLGVALLATAAWLVWIAGTTSGTADPRATGGAGERWEAWAPDRVATRLAAGDPVFVYFTADWCITCKVNERRVLDDPRVRESLDRLEVAAFRADWTRRDERIRRALERLGKSGVPAYVVYDPKRPHSPRTLSELLSVDELLAALRDAAHPGEDVSPVSPITVSTSRTSMDSDEATQTGGV